MNLINNIAKYKSLILVIGMVAALGIIAQPVVSAYAECEITAADQQQDSTDDDNPNEAQISTLEALAPTAQIHFAPLDFVLEETVDHEITQPDGLSKTLVRLPEKLLKVLFNIIIAPNAP